MVKAIENITKRKDGRFMGRFVIGRDTDGKAVYQYVYGKTPEDAEKKVMLGKAIESLFLSGKNISVKNACSQWLCAAANRVKESSYANYKMKIEKHILPEFGDVLCSELSADVINAFIRKKIESGLSSGYVRDILTVFKTMLKYAQEEYGFKLSLSNVALPKCRKKEAEKLQAAEQSLLVNYLKRHMDITSLGILISLLMGLRIGELCGLRWSDVDFDGGILYINRTVQRISVCEGSKKTKVTVSPPKSEKSRRKISIPDSLLEYLKKFKSEGDFYILSGSNKPTEPRTMQYRYKKILKKAETPSHNFHQLRHTFATNCMENGFDVKTLSNVLGHSSVSITLDRYVHPDVSHQRRLMNNMCRLF
ncbi:MAG: site-specific integrase [Eubacterium sp.]|nr:site-specific integrase [Eubacterium sp.]